MLGAAHALAVDCDADALELAADNCAAFKGIAVRLSGNQAILQTRGAMTHSFAPRQ